VKRIYSAQNTLMVDHLKHALDAEGIGCVVRNRFLAGAAGRLPPTECWTELWILDDAELPDARRVLHRAFDEEDTAGGESWECPRCGERLEPQFEACWKCSTLRTAGGEDVIDGEVPALKARVRRPSTASGEMKVWVLLGLMAIAAWYIARSFARSGW
jgi:hypothetical protein